MSITVGGWRRSSSCWRPASPHWWTLLRCRSAEHLSDKALQVVLGLAIVTLALMIVVGELGWEISHHELRVDRAPSALRRRRRGRMST